MYQVIRYDVLTDEYITLYRTDDRRRISATMKVYSVIVLPCPPPSCTAPVADAALHKRCSDAANLLRGQEWHVLTEEEKLLVAMLTDRGYLDFNETTSDIVN